MKMIKYLIISSLFISLISLSCSNQAITNKEFIEYLFKNPEQAKKVLSDTSKCDFEFSEIIRKSRYSLGYGFERKVYYVGEVFYSEYDSTLHDSIPKNCICYAQINDRNVPLHIETWGYIYGYGEVTTPHNREWDWFFTFYYINNKWYLSEIYIDEGIRVLVDPIPMW